LRWAPLLGALGGATGAIAIGTVATSTSTTTIISIGTTIRPSTGVKLARATTGSTIHSTAEMRPMEIGRQRISLEVRLAGRVAQVAVPELEHVPEAAEPEHGQAAGPVPSRAAALELAPEAAALEHGPVAGPVPSRAAVLELAPEAAALEHGPVAGPVPNRAAELEHDLVAVELEPGPAAVVLRTK
jgi:hypothetical protein